MLIAAEGVLLFMYFRPLAQLLEPNMTEQAKNRIASKDKSLLCVNSHYGLMRQFSSHLIWTVVAACIRTTKKKQR